MVKIENERKVRERERGLEKIRVYYRKRIDVKRSRRENNAQKRTYG